MDRATELLLSAAALLIVAALTPLALGIVIRVPQDVPTIQAGLDSLQDGDTVLVSLGTYAEALVAPPLHFTLMGDVVPDTGEYPRPIIDPSPLPGSDSLGCLILPLESWPVLEDLVFRNGAQMYPHQENKVGGIRCQSNDVTIRRCVFDSTFRTLQFVFPGPGLNLVDSLLDCTFRDLQYVGVRQLDYAVVALNCTFESGQAVHLCLGADHSRFSFSRFGTNPDGYGLIADGDDIEVSNCAFGPTDNRTECQLLASTAAGVIRANVFTQNIVLNAALRCIAHGPNAFVVENNVFADNLGWNSGTCLRVDTIGAYQPGWGGTIRNNSFTNCFSQSGAANVVVTNQDMSISRNHFSEFEVDMHGHPSVAVTRGDQTVLRENLFLNTGYALAATIPILDAELNWWGDDSGPYHASENPFGEGDTITGNVDFIPWYEDTLFLSVGGRGQPLPQRFIIEAYPNPFNSTVHLTLIPSEAQIVKVDLFDLLGRKVKEIWSGPLAFKREINFDASALASGIYFARVTDIINRRPLATGKLVLLK